MSFAQPHASLPFIVLQHDNHIQNLSVAETVNFAHTCHSGFGEPEFNLPGELCKAKVGVVVGWGEYFE
jgi:hypothetical protein